MGLFGSSTPAGLPPQKIAPNRTQRAACWEARDGFFACLDANNIIDAIKEAPKAKSACGAQEVAFERDCVGSWVEYFKKRRVMEHNREQMLKGLQNEGAKQIDVPQPVGQAQTSPK
ncbi:cytochrome oxidase c subunit VIb-domain-containing protein [Tricharina praecox]|uniref:cytochrome oxidase c subunit VIb-domain-containing protein n=1 Tax=Tricharina praecox TaxID=43433 RepID=UPI00221EFCD1|nr:cytochrome oxidase c subunit VIb-domain-containing protein [Tricharina praecox]KAI5858012.1 cytochrome oxidase c subunit VIb-domain-containing protein [Tricharina praecox]